MDLPRPPEDVELRNIIDKLAQFVARNGPEFEQMTKNKQRDNPKFAFLFGGEFFNYYQYRVTTEQALLKQKFIREQSQPMGYPPSNYGPPHGVHEHSGPHGPNHQYGRPYNYGPPPPAWNQPHQGPPPMPNQMPPFPGQNPMPPPQTDLVALRGAKDVLVAQQKQLQEQIKQSEQNLAAQHQVTLQQQKHQGEEVVKLQNEKEVFQKAHECGISLPEFDSLLSPIMESCTKESISQGKSWILHHAQQQQTADAIGQYLLFKTIQSNQFTQKLHLIYLVNDVIHHCGRKGVNILLRTLEHSIVQMFCNASLLASDEEQRGKLQKLLNLWQAKGDLFERSVLDRLHSPQQAWNEYHSSLVARYSAAINAATSNLQHTYEKYRGQHHAFVSHAQHQLQQLEQQKQQIEEQIKAASAPMPPFGPPHHQGPPDYYSRPPPMPAPGPPSNFPPEGIEPKAPYFDLPAGLMVPLIKIDDSEYKGIDPKDIRLPPPLPPSERLIQAIDLFYAPPSHDRPRNAEGWEQLALYEFYKNKTAAKKKKEEDIAQGLRQLSPPPSPVDIQEDTKPEEKGSNGVKSPTRKRFRSESPEDDQRDDDRRNRSRSRSPRSNLKLGRSRSSSTSPRRVPSHSDSRSDSRSNSPYCQAPSFQPARSPTPPTELASMSFSKGTTSRLDESNRGHQLLRKMGWGGAGLGANEQGIAEPIKGGEIRDRVDQYKGVGVNIHDPFESFRKSKGQAFITRMRSRAEEREKEKSGGEEPPTP